MFRVSHFRSFAELPDRYGALLAAAAGRGFFHEPAWFGFLMAYVFHEHNEMRLYTVEDTETAQPLLLVPMRYTTADTAVPRAHTVAAIGHLENYSELCLMFDPEVHDRGTVLAALFGYLKDPIAGEQPPCVDVLRLWPLEIGSELAEVVWQAFRRSGYWVQAYANSYNRYEQTGGMDYEAYFARRSANVRYNVRRRQRNLEKQGALELKIYTEEDGLDAAIADYVAVSRASWKSLPSMIDAAWLHLIRLTARHGCLRLGILRLDGKAAAAQFWIVTGGIAHCIRLAHDEAYKRLAVGVVLTNHMIVHVLDRDHVDQIDYGYGADEYKGSWMKDARYYAGCMAFNPGTPRGRYFGIKHIIGQPFKRAIKWPLLLLLGRLRRAPKASGSA